MRKSKEIANELCVVYADAIMQSNWSLFTSKLSEVFKEVAVDDVKALRIARNVTQDSGLVPIFKEQRQKYMSICKVVNQVKPQLLNVTDFDEVIKEIHPSIYGWYLENVVNEHFTH